MPKYRIYVKLKDQEFWVIAENGKIKKNPTKEALMGTNLRTYSSTNICPECEKENNITDNSILYPGNARRKIDEKGNKIEEWLCGRHGNARYEKNNPNSRLNLLKMVASRRTGNLIEPRHLLAEKCQKLTCVWLGVEDLNLKLNNYHAPIDHSPIPNRIYIEIGGKSIDLKGNVPQTKGGNFSIYRGNEGGWQLTSSKRERNKKFDILIFYCISKDNTIERIYIFPKYLTLSTGMTIGKKPKYGIQWYNSYMVTDKKELDKVNKIWTDL